jgi:hypothetical protein
VATELEGETTMMATLLGILGWACFGLALLAGLLLDLVGLFGNWIILAAVAVAWLATGRAHFGGWGIAILAGLALLGEVLETVASGYGASRFGGGKGAMLAAVAGCLVGAVLGTPWFPIVGTLLGACVGSFIGATIYEYLVVQKEAPAALWTGLGAALGKVAGLFAKLIVGFAMVAAAAMMF